MEGHGGVQVSRFRHPRLQGAVVLDSPTAAEIAHTARVFHGMFGVRPEITVNGRFGALGALQSRVTDVGEVYITLNAQRDATPIPLDPTTGTDVSVSFTIPAFPNKPAAPARR